MAPYPYRPLDLPNQTRILTIAPGKFDDDLVCSISHLDVRSAEPYDALSYCWSRSVRPPEEAVDPELECVGFAVGADEAQPPQTIKFGDMLDHPWAHSFYVRLGGAMPEETIACDGVDVAIGGELGRALRRVRPEPKDEDDDNDDDDAATPPPPLRLWVDALCINQADVEERNRHVQIMGEIYAHAAVVRVWLGEEIGVEVNAVAVLEGVADIVKDVGDEAFSTPSPDNLAGQVKLFQHPKFETLEWDRLGDFLDRAWFERSWVIQEIANAREAEILCGRFRIPWDMLLGPVSLLRQNAADGPIRNPSAVKAVCMMGRLQRERREASHSSPMRLLDLLEELREFKSTMASDKIYAILAMADGRDRVAVDYAKTPEQLFTEFATGQLRSGSLDVLCHCVASRVPSALDLPSWVPDWTRPGFTEPFRRRGLRCSAGGDTKPQLRIVEAGRLLQIKGRLLDTVAAIDHEAQIPPGPPGKRPSFIEEAHPDPMSLLFEKPKDRHERWIEESRLAGKRSIDNIMNIAMPGGTFSWAQYESVWRTFMCNRTRDNEVPEGCYGPAWEALMTHYSFNSTPDEVARHKGVEPVPYPASQTAGREGKTFADTLRTFRGAHSKWCYARRFFRSGKGRHGWAVDGAREGDFVVLLYGCHYPLVVRPGPGGRCRIVGDCYIHGLMDGEGLGPTFEEIEFDFI